DAPGLGQFEQVTAKAAARLDEFSQEPPDHYNTRYHILADLRGLLREVPGADASELSWHGQAYDLNFLMQQIQAARDEVVANSLDDIKRFSDSKMHVEVLREWTFLTNNDEVSLHDPDASAALLARWDEGKALVNKARGGFLQELRAQLEHGAQAY